MSYKIKTLHVQRLRNVLEAKIEFDWSLVKISWDNWAWKSTIVDAIFLAILWKTYIGKWRNIENLVTNWQEKSEIEVTLEWSWKKLRITRKVTENGNTSLDIRSSDPDEKLYQKDLDNLLSEFTVDPLEFTNKTKKEQYEIMKTVSWIDTTRIENEIELQEEKTKSARAIATEHKKTLENAWTPEKVERVDVSKYTEEYEQAQQHNNKIDRMVQERENIQENIQKLKRELSLLEWRLWSANEEIEKAGDKRDTTAIKELLDTADETNKKATMWERYVELKQKASDTEVSLIKNKELLEELREQRKKMIQEAQMPIENMEFNEKEWVIINDIPFDQHSSAEQLKYACKISTSLNPELKVIYIKDGSLLDSKSMEQLAQFSETEWYQILCERVWEEADSIVMREGEIVNK